MTAGLRAAVLRVTIALLLSAACGGGAAPSPTIPPTPAPVAIATAVPTQSEWDQLVGAAKAEGVLKLSGPRGLPEFKAVIADGFAAKYGIKVEYTEAGSSGVLKPMLDTAAGATYPWDVLVGGFDSLFANLQPKGALAPIEPLLLLPEVKDASKWIGAKVPYFNSAKTGIAFMKQAGQYFYVDSTKIDPDSIKTYRDLLDPKWRGQILLTGDPREGGHGRSVFALFLRAEGLGEPFVRQLVTTQQLIIPKDDADADRLLGAGKYLMCICNNSQGTDLLKRSPSFKKLDPHKVKEGTSTTSSFANLAVPARVAHPNAAKLYVNWILSSETGLAMAKATGVPSSRADVARDFLPAGAIAEATWPSGSDETALKDAEEAAKLAVQLLGPKN